MSRLLPTLFRKPNRRVFHHIIAASLIIAYWWALWNILDMIFLHHTMSTTEIISVVSVAVVSLLIMFFHDMDFSDLQ